MEIKITKKRKCSKYCDWPECKFDECIMEEGKTEGLPKCDDCGGDILPFPENGHLRCIDCDKPKEQHRYSCQYCKGQFISPIEANEHERNCKEQQSNKGMNTCPECNGKGEWENHEDSDCQFERCSSCNGTGKASEASLNAIYDELQKEAYDIEHHVYDYKQTNQIIRKRFEAYTSQAVADREKEIVTQLERKLAFAKDNRHSKTNEGIQQGYQRAINLITKDS